MYSGNSSENVNLGSEEIDLTNNKNISDRSSRDHALFVSTYGDSVSESIILVKIRDHFCGQNVSAL